MFVQAFLNGLSSPTEVAFGLSRTAVIERQADLGREQASLMAGQPLSGYAQQFVVGFWGAVHGAILPAGIPRGHVSYHYLVRRGVRKEVLGTSPAAVRLKIRRTAEEYGMSPTMKESIPIL